VKTRFSRCFFRKLTR